MIIPVFDVKDGMCVSGKSGFRDTYTRLDSVYGDDIFEMSLGLRDAGARVVYIADLDRIMGVGDNSGLISEVNRVVPVLLDNGASCVDDIIFNKNICTYPILATETMNSISDVEQIFEEMPHDNIVISVDIKDNELLIKNKCINLDDIIRLINKVKPAYTILLPITSRYRGRKHQQHNRRHHRKNTIHTTHNSRRNNQPKHHILQKEGHRQLHNRHNTT